MNLGRLGLWMHRRRHRAAGAVDLPEPPPGKGPLIWLRCTSAQAGPALQQIVKALKGERPDLRLVLSGRDQGWPDPGEDSQAVMAMLDRLQPAALILLGSELPVTLASEAAARAVPLFWAEASLSQAGQGFWRQAMMRELMRCMTRIMVTDASSRHMALGFGAEPDQILITGPVTDIQAPLPCTEAERVALVSQTRGRLIWLAAALPEAEEDAVLAAHAAAQRHSHRALLILVPDDPRRAPVVARKLEADGWVVAQRAEEEEPEEDVQVLIADDPAELGLWYRLAPLCYMGSTLSSGDSRHPFEPAALGSAIIHGPATGGHARLWQQLDAAGAARPVADAAGLAAAIVDLTAPDKAAELASAAWLVSTGGAAVAREIARPVLESLPR